MYLSELRVETRVDVNMASKVLSVLSAAKGVVGGGTIIPFVITTALDSI